MEVTAEANPILMYHGVSTLTKSRFKKFVVTPADFEWQMEYIASGGRRGCSISELVAARRSEDLEARHLVGLTFDDAFQELRPNAAPVLERLGFSATIYAPTAYIGGSSEWLKNFGEARRRILSPDELRDLASRGIEIGAHSHTHVALDLIPAELARQEILQSKEILEEAIEREVRTFAYPFGYENGDVRMMVTSAGYASACRVNYSASPRHEDVYGLSRLPVDGGCGPERFVSLLTSDSPLRHRRVIARAWRPARRALASVTGTAMQIKRD